METEKIIITIEHQLSPQMVQQDDHPCTHCSNNIKNNPHASGTCCCMLPTLWMQRHNSKWDVVSTTTPTSDCSYTV